MLPLLKINYANELKTTLQLVWLLQTNSCCISFSVLKPAWSAIYYSLQSPEHGS